VFQKKKDIKNILYLFIRRILDRGYNSEHITILFLGVIDNAMRYLELEPSLQKGDH
jgi:hypothetical protein